MKLSQLVGQHMKLTLEAVNSHISTLQQYMHNIHLLGLVTMQVLL